MTRILTEAEIILKLPDFRWTLERYHAAIEAGILTEYDKVELLFGKLVTKYPVGIAHGKVVKKINRLFISRFSEEDYTVGVQDPITLIDDTEPEPDLFVAEGPLEDYDHHPYPSDLLLVVEVSDSTLTHDRSAKRFTYAIAGIEEYWIINVFEKQVERFISPLQEKGDYEKKEVFKVGDTFTSLHLGEFTVADLLLKD
jgi:Uma2 family endonuclease